MSAHTYIPLTVSAQGDTVTLTGTADGIGFSVMFNQSAVTNMSNAQLMAFLKSIIDAEVFPVPSPIVTVLTNAIGKAFTL